jgi:large subunit ribosomal protein L30e
MQTAKVGVNKQIQIVVKTGKVAFGLKEAMDAARFAKAKLLILASNLPTVERESITQYAKQSQIPIYNYPGTSVDLGAACAKPFTVAALIVNEPGDSEILKLAAG